MASDDEYQLYKELFTSYNPHLLPWRNKNYNSIEKTTVYFGVSLVAMRIDDIHDVTADVTVNVWLQMVSRDFVFLICVSVSVCLSASASASASLSPSPSPSPSPYPSITV